jgi:DNA-binding NarL/FixJ family response regulator
MEKQGRGELRLLLVEDLHSVRLLLRDLVRVIGGFEVVYETATEAEAKLWIDENAAAWDVAVVDLVLASGSGMTVVAHAKRVHPGAKIAVFSGYASEGIRSHCLRLGADQVFDKVQTEAFVRWLSSLRDQTAATEQ